MVWFCDAGRSVPSADTLLFQSFLLEAIVSDVGKDRGGHSLKLFIQHFLADHGIAPEYLLSCSST